MRQLQLVAQPPARQAPPGWELQFVSQLAEQLKMSATAAVTSIGLYANLSTANFGGALSNCSYACILNDKLSASAFPVVVASFGDIVASV